MVMETWYNVRAQVPLMRVSFPRSCKLSPRIPLVLVIFLLISGVLCASLAQASQPTQTQSVQAHFEAARQAQQRQDYAAAEREYQAVLTVAPEFAEAHMNLGLVYQLQNRNSDAMMQFRRALKLKPALAGANFFLGVDYCKLGEATKAIPFLSAAAKAEPARADTWSWLATALEMSGQFPAEMATLKRALKLHPKNIDLLYLLGQTYERLGKEEVATLQRLAPKSWRAEQLLAESYATSSQWPSAVIHFQNALAVSPQARGLHVELGEVFLRAGKLKPANDEFEAELNMDPHNLRALVRRGEAKLIRGDVDGALQDWANAMAIDPLQAERVLGIRESGFGDSSLEQLPDADRDRLGQLVPVLREQNTPAGNFALAFIAAQNGNASPAAADSGEKPGTPSARCSEAHLHQQLEQGHLSGLAPCALRTLTASPARFRIQVASALVEAGDYDASLKLLAGLPPSERQSPEASYWRARGYEKLATAAYLQLYQADPDSYRLHQLMADLEASREDDARAMEEYRAAIALKPSVPNLHYSLGHLLWKNLKIPEARVELETELSINARHPGALHDLGGTYLLEHQPDKALSYLTRALALAPANPDIHRDLGTAYTQLGQLQKAESEYKIALPSDHDGSIHYKLARVYQSLGRKEDAAREFTLSTGLNRESHEKLERQTQRVAEIEKLTQ